MKSLSNEQLIAVTQELDQAIINHHEWYRRLLRLIVTRTAPSHSDMDPNGHTQCLFGIWYDNHVSEALKKTPHYLSIKHNHYAAHQYARQLLQHIQEEQIISVEEWDQFENSITQMNKELFDLKEQLHSLTHNRDPLTGAKTRALMLNQLQRYHNNFKNKGENSALVLLDLDHFKKINDQYGHSAGDQVLIAVVDCIEQHLRPNDTIYRYGGEEFIIFIPNVALEQAKIVIERIRKAINSLSIALCRQQSSIRITASFGITQFVPSRSVEQSIDYADEAMYQAKREGRNCVRVSY